MWLLLHLHEGRTQLSYIDALIESRIINIMMVQSIYNQEGAKVGTNIMYLNCSHKSLTKEMMQCNGIEWTSLKKS